MKLVLFGATGMVGSRIATEASARGHQVTAVSRSGQSPVPGVTTAVADISDRARVAELAAGADAVASACAPPRDGANPQAPFLVMNQSLVEGVRAAGVRRLVVVGGAGSLEVAPGQALADQPGFPEDYLPEALAQRDVLTYLRTLDDEGLDWTYVSPAPEIAPGERTGRFRIGGDQLLTEDHHAGRISAEDYAVAFVDELEKDAHPRARMSVAY
ncbi:NAD(P)-dependent oxidoreductase [Streptomyces sp. NPDC005808]|uniref:NAD(P)-dependent oxidoreductase n=1 Tax=Streptomyces sp. NPDC005808 TaxID=3364734 RepID=UPI003684179C